MNVFHYNLETIEATSFGSLDLAGVALNKVFVDDAIRGGEEGEDV